jgi:hypothetical protein
MLIQQNQSQQQQGQTQDNIAPQHDGQNAVKQHSQELAQQDPRNRGQYNGEGGEKQPF